MFYSASFLVFYAPRKKITTVFLSTVTSFSLLFIVAMPYMQRNKSDRMYFLSFGKPSAVFITENNQPVAFLADHYKRQEIENILIPLLKKERTDQPVGLFYTSISYNHTGTLNALKKNTKVRRVYEHPAVRETFGFHYNDIYLYRGLPGLFEFLSQDGEISAAGLRVEVLGAENGMLSYVIRKGGTSILLAPYLGETLSEKIQNRKFTVACIWDIRTTAKTRKNLETVDYIYLVLPQDYKKFGKLKNPRMETFYLNDGAVKIDFHTPPFRIFHWN